MFIESVAKKERIHNWGVAFQLFLPHTFFLQFTGLCSTISQGQYTEIKHLIWLTCYSLAFLGSWLGEDPPLGFYNLTGIYTEGIPRAKSLRKGIFFCTRWVRWKGSAQGEDWEGSDRSLEGLPLKIVAAAFESRSGSWIPSGLRNSSQVSGVLGPLRVLGNLCTAPKTLELLTKRLCLIFWQVSVAGGVKHPQQLLSWLPEWGKGGPKLEDQEKLDLAVWKQTLGKTV